MIKVLQSLNEVKLADEFRTPSIFSYYSPTWSIITSHTVLLVRAGELCLMLRLINLSSRSGPGFFDSYSIGVSPQLVYISISKTPKEKLVYVL